ncbi:MAG: ABC transporter permease [Clostridia bacterium]|nr:ABC transporter permease [Clostridia bacterium]
MRIRVFAWRCMREVFRDPLTLFFGALFPLILLLLLSAIQANIPVSMFEIDALAPGICVFGQSFLALFTALMISKDRSSALIKRLTASPMGSFEFLLGYMLPMIPLALLQGIVCLLAGGILGMNLRYIPLTLIALLPPALLYISLGLLCGIILNDKQVGGICGALLTNLSAWLSGIWFDVSLVGGVFEKIANALPFIHSVRAAQAAAAGDMASMLSQLIIPSVYGTALLILGIILFRRSFEKA